MTEEGQECGRTRKGGGPVIVGGSAMQEFRQTIKSESSSNVKKERTGGGNPEGVLLSSLQRQPEL